MKPIAQIFTLALLLVTAEAVHSQTERGLSYKFGMELNTSLSSSSWTSTPTFSFQKWNKQTVELGLGTNIADQWYWGPKPFTGVVLTTAYKFYPIGKDHKLNFYFHYNLKHYMFLSKLNGYSPDKIRHYNENFLGYGFDVPIGKRFYFNHDLSAGILSEWTSYQTGGSSNPRVYISGNFRIGLGYKIGQKD